MLIFTPTSKTLDVTFPIMHNEYCFSLDLTSFSLPTSSLLRKLSFKNVKFQA